jgi:hypothetical protein
MTGIIRVSTKIGGFSSGVFALPTYAAAASGYSPEATQFLARITDPGTTRKNAYAALIDGGVADGWWVKLSGLWILAADIAANALVNLKSSTGNLTATGSPAFSPNHGYTGDGLAANLATGVTVSSFPQFLQDDASMWVWSLTAGQHSWYAMGEASGSAISAAILPRFSDDATYFKSNDGSARAASVHPADGSGLFGWSRSASNLTKVYRNGSQLGANDTVASTGLPTSNILLLGQGGSYTNAQIAAGAIGANLNAGTLAADFYNRMQTYMTAVGA